MKKIRNSDALDADVRAGQKGLLPGSACSALIVFAGLAALTLLAGCASDRFGGSSDPSHYNVNTGYPAIGTAGSGL